jgi:hypothetical protein
VAHDSGTDPDLAAKATKLVFYTRVKVGTVYRRFREQCHLAPEGLHNVASWVSENLQRCFQLMECEDRELLAHWMARWEDLVDFEVFPVITPADVVAALVPRL